MIYNSKSRVEFTAPIGGTIELAALAITGHELIELQVTTGSLVQGVRLVIMTDQGEILGAVAPYVLHSQSVTAAVAIPRSAIVGGRLRLRSQIDEPGAAGRPPRPGEVEHLNLVVTPQKKIGVSLEQERNQAAVCIAGHTSALAWEAIAPPPGFAWRNLWPAPPNRSAAKQRHFPVRYRPTASPIRAVRTSGSRRSLRPKPDNPLQPPPDISSAIDTVA